MRASPPSFIALMLLAIHARAPAKPVGEPFLIRNESPISRLYGLPAGEDASAVAPTGFQARVALDIANNSFEGVRGADRLVLDGETWCTRVLLQHGWRNGWRVVLQLPFVSQQGGATDGFIEGYHHATGLPPGNRERWPADRLEYSYHRGRETSFSLTDSTAGWGDLRLSALAPLWRDRAESRTLSAVAGVELPTGDPDRLLGSGSTDFSLGLAACDVASLSGWNIELHGSAGALVLSTGDILKDQQRHFAGYGGLSLGWRLAAWIQPRLQFDWHSPFFSDMEMTPLDGWAAVLVSGATIFLPWKVALDIAVAEDVAVHTAPDVVFHVAIRMSL